MADTNAECLICGATCAIIDNRYIYVDSRPADLCPTCRRRLRVGELVEGMNDDTELRKFKHGFQFVDQNYFGPNRIYTTEKTALEALEKGAKA